MLQQQATMDKIERGELLSQQIFQMTVIKQPDVKSAPTVLEARLSEMEQERNRGSGLNTARQPSRCVQVTTQPTKLLPWTARFGRWGFAAQLVAVPGPENTRYSAAMHVSLLGKLYSVQLRVSSLGFPFSVERKLHIHNIVPDNSEMTVACRAGDFDTARALLMSNTAHGSDVTASGWPVLDVSKHKRPL